jgi:hypothetical protein
MEKFCTPVEMSDVDNPIWSKNSCGFARMVFQEPPEPFTTLNQALTLRVLADRRKEQHTTLMGSQRGSVVRRERLGGLLSYYHREAA